MGWKLDTSGSVRLHAKDATWKGLPKPDIYWEDLSPFAQGYVEALLRYEFDRSIRRDLPAFGFSDLAAETLARIIDDCAGYCERYPDSKTPDDGKAFWRTRNANSLANWFAVLWPRLTPYLGDDGLIYLRAEGREGAGR